MGMGLTALVLLLGWEIFKLIFPKSFKILNKSYCYKADLQQVKIMEYGEVSLSLSLMSKSVVTVTRKNSLR